MQIQFLGTGCMMPTKTRNLAGVLLSYKAENILFDVGEGTQRQLKIAGIKPGKVTKILISHWHGDHVLGLPGLLQTFMASQYHGTLEIYGPRGSKKYFENMMKGFAVKEIVEYKLKEIGSGKFFETNDFYLEALPMKHGAPCVGFAFVEKERRRIDIKKAKRLGLTEGPLLGKLQKGQAITLKGKKIKPDEVSDVVEGKKVVYVTDTEPCDNIVKLAKGADLLIMEATYSSQLQEKAEEYGHLTAKEAGMLANQAHVKKLILTHFSQRYKNVKELEEDARQVFDDTVAAEDFMKVRL
ncbi:ribonuclease Z [Candidatus Woesearchaeota archaeon]|nr:ribonuclease Z [Candidatus Woesearchaeota archaeon]